ncbi:MAG: hypothetical protein C7B45_03840 [Sulfobacillus acidophilus]|uniref:Uncharacterized protein n=1 Tax=Sulfobacillus acidophilus TaxID=53633 RepID=A0A2T2WLW7_9FIRM|nr:MAG: hypothetical protein C7B45_03840 [Sulfobacillus acidophilus]
MGFPMVINEMAPYLGRLRSAERVTYCLQNIEPEDRLMHILVKISWVNIIVLGMGESYGGKPGAQRE